MVAGGRCTLGGARLLSGLTRPACRPDCRCFRVVETPAARDWLPRAHFRQARGCGPVMPLRYAAPMRSVPPRRGLLSGLVLAALFLLGALGFGFSLTRPSASAPRRVDALVPLNERKVAPSLAGDRPLTGQTLSLAPYRGRVLFINFWASWCAPCRKEAPELARFAASLDPHKAAIVGVDINDKSPDALRFLARFHLSYANSSDPKLTLFHRYGVFGIPTTVVIDARSTIAARLLGPQTERTFGRLLSRLLSEARP